MRTLKKYAALFLAVIMILPVLTVNSFAASAVKVEIVKTPMQTTFVKGADWDYGHWTFPEDEGLGVFTPDGKNISFMHQGGYFSRYLDRGMLDMSGLIVKVTYSDGTVKNIEYKEKRLSNGVVTQNIYYSPKGGEFQVGENIIEVYFMEGNVASKGYATYKINITERNGIKGDVNMDTKINSADALLVLQHSVQTITLTESQRNFADMNSDQKVNSMDALMILQKSVGSI